MKGTLYTGGTIYTMEPGVSVAEAVLVENGRIQAVGKRTELEKDAEKVVDLEGKTMLPAFIDSHSHLMGVANGMLQVDLAEASSFAELKERIENFIRENQVPPGKWVLAKGINHGNLKEKHLPEKAFLDGITEEHPLLIQHTSGHSGVLNSMGLAELGITDKTPDPDGGRIDFAAGLLEENALIQNMDKFPLPTGAELISSFEKAQHLYASKGITTVQEGMFVEQIKGIYAMLYEQNRLWLDVVAYMDLKNSPELIDAFPSCKGTYDHHLKVGGYKALLDGSPQSKTAWVTKPYTDGTKGYPMYSDEELEPLVERAVREQQQLLMHANGDAAADQYLRVYEKVTKKWGPGIRPVLIHGQIMRYDQVEEMARLGITPSFFLAHVYHWGDVHMENLGIERARRISPVRDAKENQISFTLHQDSPVILPDMMETVWCAVNRKTKNGVVLGGEQKLSVYEALQAITINAAKQYGEEQEKGTIAPSKRADFVVLDKDPMTAEPNDIRNIQVMMTVKDGQTIYQA